MAATNLPFRDINVHASSTHYSFTSPSNPSAPSLVVDRPSGRCWLSGKPMAGGKRVTSISGILGMISLRLDKYIMVITKSTAVGRINGNLIFKVQAVEFLPLREGPLRDPDEDTYTSLLRTLLRDGPMYFSYTFDLTNSFQRQVHSDPNVPLWQRADDRFFWNRHVQSELINLRSSNPAVDPYILPVIFGMLRITPTAIKATPMSFILITRKSRFRAGTRFFTRGIDEEGHVANYNETEQIVVVGDTGGAGGFDSRQQMPEKSQVHIMSYVQTRGSVPVFWAEVNNLKYTPKLQVRSIDPTNAARKHFQEQVRIYGDNYLVNLVNQTGREKNIKDAYENVVRTVISSPMESKEESIRSDEQFRQIEPGQTHSLMDKIHYIFFDFHHECKGLKFHRSALLLDQMGQALIDQKYFHMTDGVEGTIVRNAQTSVVRSNCMDCLDRTNVVQSMLARWTLNRQLRDIGILEEGEGFESVAAFEFLFRNVWADNADVVSRAYSGTGALKTDFTRTGKRSTAGLLQDGQNSVVRYIKNNFLDGPRQDAYDLFLGTYLPSVSASSNLVFIDRRPVFVQSMPYILIGALIMLFAAAVTPSAFESSYPIRIFIAFWLVVAAYCLNFIRNFSILYVNWPKLNPLNYALEAYNDAMMKASKDKIVGRYISKKYLAHERGYSNVRLVSLEEGKKRRE